MEQGDLEFCVWFLNEVGVPVTFCKKVGISTSTFYAWKHGRLKLAAATLQRIKNYLKNYNY